MVTGFPSPIIETNGGLYELMTVMSLIPKYHLSKTSLLHVQCHLDIALMPNLKYEGFRSSLGYLNGFDLLQ